VDGAVLGIVGFVAALVAFDLVALRYGHDSRVAVPEEPLGVARSGDAAATGPRRPVAGLRLPPLAGLIVGRPAARGRRLATQFAPYLCRETACALRPDLAALGK
jgi:hypothetical protein